MTKTQETHGQDGPSARLKGSVKGLQVLLSEFCSLGSALHSPRLWLQATPCTCRPQKQYPYGSPCTRQPLAWMIAYIVGTESIYIVSQYRSISYSILISLLLHQMPIQCPYHIQLYITTIWLDILHTGLSYMTYSIGDKKCEKAQLKRRCLAYNRQAGIRL